MDERKRIGDLLLDAGVITEAQLREALAEQASSGGRLCHNLVRLGHLTADDLVGFLRDQFGVAAVNLERYRVAPEVLRLLPAAFARERGMVPLHLLGRVLTVAMADPSRAEDLAAARALTGLATEAVICPASALEDALRRFYPEEGEGVLALGDEGEGRRIGQPAVPAEGFTAEEWLRRFVLQAVRRRSLEIHLEPVEAGLRARFRVRGQLQEGETAPVALRREITLRALALAGAAVGGAAGLPVEGRFRIQVRSRWLRAALSGFPTLFGPRLVIRIVDESLLAREFQELGMSKEVADEVQRLLALRNGVLFVTAPPGHGKHTTFSSMLVHARGEGGRNVMTLEDPVRLPLAGVSQTAVGGTTGLGFAAALRSMLHQEPDVVGITDAPDAATLQLVFSLARRSLVVVLCAFREACGVLDWVREAGIGAATQGLLLRGVLAQRLLPKLCTGCREPLAEPVTLLEGVREKRPEELSFYGAGGCELCAGTGRAGRVGCFELLAFRAELRDLLLRGEPCRVIADEAQRLGMWTLREEGVLKASEGLVDIGEVLEATPGAEVPAP